MKLPVVSRRRSIPITLHCEPRELLGSPLDQRSLWAELSENFHDTFFPSRLPPLELTSKPIPVADPLAARTNPWAIGGATFLNGLLAAVLILLGTRAMPRPNRPPVISPVDLNDFQLAAPQVGERRGGGSGGNQDLIDPSTGRPPKFENSPASPPQVQLAERPVIPLDAAAAVPPDVRIPENSMMPLVGVTRSTNVTLASDGPGNGAGIGTNTGRGDGSGGDGNGDGPGWNRGIGGGVYVPGNGVSNPIPIVTPDAEFSDEARRQKYQGACVIALIVDAQGYPRSLHVVRPLGMGLDEKALEAVERYRFKPAKKDGKPVAVRMIVEVNFRLF